VTPAVAHPLRRLPNPRTILRACLPHGYVQARAERRRYARRWPEVARDAATRELIASSGLELVPEWVDLAAGVFVDIGAHAGEWTAAVHAIRPRARVVLVEPQPALAALLRERFSVDVVHEVAAGATPGQSNLHLTANPHLASLRLPSPEIVAAYAETEWWELTGSAQVEVARVDDLLDEEPVTVMKVDVQGYEREALTGARAVLARTAAVLIEMNFTRYYEGETSFAGLHDLLTAAGFVLVGMTPSGRLRDGRLAWCDACYARPMPLA
jgi:FkbM family methyltransferase